MKKILSLVMAAALIATQAPVAAAEEVGQSSHECVTVMVTEVVEQTHTMTCADCGSAVTEAHSFGDWNTQDSQSHVSICVCGASVTQPHTWDDGVLDEAAGVRVCTCTACSASCTETIESSEEDVMKTSSEGATAKDLEVSAYGEKGQSPKAALIGDVDEDGQVTIDDLMIVTNISKGTLSPATKLQHEAADVNQDGWIDVKDVMIIYRTLIHKNEPDAVKKGM